MAQALALMQAVIGHQLTSTSAGALLDQALEAEVDPLHWCAVHLNLPEAEIMARAAAWVGIAFLEAVPNCDAPALDPGRLEALGEIRLYRLRLEDRDVAFVAPNFFGLLRLARLCAARPDLARSICIVPETALRDFLAAQASAALIDNARQNMTRLWPRAAAQLELIGPVRIVFAALIGVVTLILLSAPLTGYDTLAPFWFALIMLPSVLRLTALLTPLPPEPVASGGSDDTDLPVYSILVPLRDEANMVPQLCRALDQLDYPRHKLDITFVVESTSPSTIEALRPYCRAPHFSLRIVPDALPRTKPKALDFALPFCRGEFIVVYDAEDRPEPDQLRRIADQFRQQPDLHCIQARLVIDNGRSGWLPALFAGEYAGLFSVLLPALSRWGIVMPLGGTSNHFRTPSLRELGGWDAFNVTEDADLGVRLARRQMRCATSPSRTYEAAPTRLLPWMGQRTRWMKGWFQTYAVHNRHANELLADLGWREFIGLQLVLLGMLMPPLLHAGFLITLPILFLTGQLTAPELQPWPVACFAVLVMGSTIAILINLVGLARTGQRDLIWRQVAVPLYWALISAATLLALREFTLRPFHWFKSPHHISPRPSSPSARPERAPAATVAPVHPPGNSVQRLGRKPITDRSVAG